MQAVTILAVGKLKEGYLRDAAAEYQKRLSAFCKLKIIEIDEERLPQDPSPALIQKTLEAEGRRILAKIPTQAYVVPLCIEGRQLPSEKLAEKLEALATSGCSQIVFIIGGSHGLADAVKARADFKLSMSEMTFPHQLARVMLLEQVYRAYSILTGTKYHK